MVDTIVGRTASGASRSKAHSRSVQISVEDITVQLLRILGKHLLALIVGRDSRSVARWAAGENHPGHVEERKLRNAFQIFELLASVESDHTVRAWFMGMNPQLNDDSPAEALAAERFQDVAAAARAFIAGG